jgi:hypothetical protein
VGHQVGSQSFQATVGHRDGFKAREARDGGVLGAFVLVLGGFEELVHQRLLLGLVESKLDHRDS